MISKHFTVLTSLFLCLSGTAVAWCRNSGVLWSSLGDDTGIGEAFRTVCNDDMALKGDIAIGDRVPGCVDLGGGHIKTEFLVEEGTESSLLMTETCEKLLHQVKDACAAYGGSIRTEAASGTPPNSLASVSGTITANLTMGACSQDQDWNRN